MHPSGTCTGHSKAFSVLAGLVRGRKLVPAARGTGQMPPTRCSCIVPLCHDTKPHWPELPLPARVRAGAQAPQPDAPSSAESSVELCPDLTHLLPGPELLPISAGWQGSASQGSKQEVCCGSKAAGLGGRAQARLWGQVVCSSQAGRDTMPGVSYQSPMWLAGVSLPLTKLSALLPEPGARGLCFCFAYSHGQQRCHNWVGDTCRVKH